MDSLGIEIDHETFLICSVLQGLDELRRKGLVGGGYDIEKDVIDSVVVLGEKLFDYSDPTEKEISVILAAFQLDLAEPLHEPL